MLIWKFLYECLNLKRAFFPSKESVYYFAFGANLSDDILVKKRRMFALQKREFVLRNYKLQFSQPGPYEGMGFASIKKAENKNVYGHLIRLNKDDARRMDYSELLPVFKRHKRVYIEQDNNSFYFYEAIQEKSGLVPTKLYLSFIVGALEKFKSVPPDYLSALKNMEILREYKLSQQTDLFVGPKYYSLPIIGILLKLYSKCSIWVFRRLVNFSITKGFVGPLKND